MQRAIVLDIGMMPDDDGRGITANDGIVPDAGSLVNGDIANNHRAGRDKDIFGNGGPYTLKWKDGHDYISLRPLRA
jgi:hypothetical protein